MIVSDRKAILIAHLPVDFAQENILIETLCVGLTELGQQGVARSDSFCICRLQRISTDYNEIGCCLTLTIVVKEEECSVLFDRSADASTELVRVRRGLAVRQSFTDLVSLVERSVRIERSIAIIFKDIPVKVV